MLAGVGVRRWSLIFAGRANLTSFPGDTPHGSAPTVARCARMPIASNLPINGFRAVVLVAAVAHLNPPNLGPLAVATLAGRIAQTSVHMLVPEANATVAIRFAFFLVQLVAMIGMGILIVIAAAGNG